MEIFLAIFIGLLFGFVLQKSGAANPQRIIDMLRLKDLHLMKAILLGIGLSSLFLFAMMALGIIDNGNLSVKTAHIGVIIGGAILGLGWAISGFCPGTGIVAAGAKRKDALFFILGGLVGAFAFTFIYGPLAPTFLFNKIGGGKATLVETGVEKYTALIPSVPAIVVAGGIAIVLIFIAWKLPDKKKG
ncbi:MAG: hypothetical protein B6D64_09160 [Bacteroidetes bacterium 4484_276]|nr:MAG: hypothetical protein B6D64_09160 [Bacteroidetes bacterium 4484_276]